MADPRVCKMCWKMASWMCMERLSDLVIDDSDCFLCDDCFGRALGKDAKKYLQLKQMANPPDLDDHKCMACGERGRGWGFAFQSYDVIDHASHPWLYLCRMCVGEAAIAKYFNAENQFKDFK